MQINDDAVALRLQTALVVRACYRRVAPSRRVRDAKPCRGLRKLDLGEGNCFEISNIQ